MAFVVIHCPLFYRVSSIPSAGLAQPTRIVAGCPR
jgi:hypothetical protein